MGYWFFHASHGLLIACFTTTVDMLHVSRVLPHLFYASVAMAMSSTCKQSCTVQHWLLYSATMASPSTLCFSWAHTLGGWSQEVGVNQFIPIYMPDHRTTLQWYRQLILSSNVNCVPYHTYCIKLKGSPLKWWPPVFIHFIHFHAMKPIESSESNLFASLYTPSSKRKQTRREQNELKKYSHTFIDVENVELVAAPTLISISGKGCSRLSGASGNAVTSKQCQSVLTVGNHCTWTLSHWPISLVQNS